MNLRDVVRIDVDGLGNWRPGVVIRVGFDFLRVAYGGRTAPPDTVVADVVQPDSRFGRALELRDPTWFRGANACFARPSEVEATGKACPLELYLRLVQLVRDHDAAVQAREDAAGR
jgi:hypothetical protein